MKSLLAIIVLLSFVACAPTALAEKVYMHKEKISLDRPSDFDKISSLTLRNTTNGLSTDVLNSMNRSFHPLLPDFKDFFGTGSRAWILSDSKTNIRKYSRNLQNLNPDKPTKLNLAGIVFVGVKDKTIDKWSEFESEDDWAEWLAEFENEDLSDYESIIANTYRNQNGLMELSIEVEHESDDGDITRYYMAYREMSEEQSIVLYYQDPEEKYSNSISIITSFANSFSSNQTVSFMSYILYIILGLGAVVFLVAYSHAHTTDRSVAAAQKIHTITSEPTESETASEQSPPAEPAEDSEKPPS